MSSVVLLIPSGLYPAPNNLERQSTCTQDAAYHYIPISLATGLKVQPLKDYSPRGDVLHDSHSEVLSRRGARKWFLERLVKEIKMKTDVDQVIDGHLTAKQSEKVQNLKNRDEVQQERNCIGDWVIDDMPRIFQHADQDDRAEDSSSANSRNLTKGGRVRIRDGIQLWFYISTLPCGDASMKLMQKEREFQDQAMRQVTESNLLLHDQVQLPGPGNVVSSSQEALGKMKQLQTLGHSASNADKISAAQPDSTARWSSRDKSEFESLTIRGRDCIDKLGRLRTKPGRADSSPSISHSCSDKLAMWSLMGLQGSVLSRWLHPILIDGYVIGDEEVGRVFAMGQGFRNEGNQGGVKQRSSLPEQASKFEEDMKNDCERALIGRSWSWTQRREGECGSRISVKAILKRRSEPELRHRR